MYFQEERPKALRGPWNIVNIGLPSAKPTIYGRQPVPGNQVDDIARSSLPFQDSGYALHITRSLSLRPLSFYLVSIFAFACCPDCFAVCCPASFRRVVQRCDLHRIGCCVDFASIRLILLYNLVS
jgi:hypothetical protein